MTNFFSTIYFALIFFIFGHPKPQLTPELKELCTAIMFDQEEKIETLMAKIDKNQQLPDHSSLINFAIEARAYNCCQKLISNGFPVTLNDLQKISWLEMLENLPVKKQIAAQVILSIQEKLAPQKNQRVLSNADIFNWRLQLQSPIGQLHKAIIENNTETISRILSDDKLDPNTRLNYISALEIAISHSNIQAINSLLNTGKIDLTEEDICKAVWRLELIKTSQPGVSYMGNQYPIKDSKVNATSLDDVDLTVKNIEEWKELLNNAQRIKAILTQNLTLQRKFSE